MIRAFREEDTERVVAIWLQASIQEHDFMPEAYWKEKTGDMRTLYLPLSEIVVDEEAGELTGFMAFVDDYLAALFVAPEHQGRGVGSRLLQLAKKMRGALELGVYAENSRAIRFYAARGFRVVGERAEEATGQVEKLMVFP